MPGVKEVGAITIVAGTLGDVLQLEVIIKLTQAAYAEYTNYSLDFLKPITVEVISSGNATTDATALKNQLNSLKDRFGSTYFTVTSNGADMTITLKDSFQKFKSITENKLVDSGLSLSQVTATILATGTISQAGKIGFGDDNWMHHRVILPTFENTRYFGISKDERPIDGGNYSEYVLRYTVAKDGNDGIISGDVSVTSHVFWVLASIVDDFEAAIYATTKPIVSVDSDQIFTLTLEWDESMSPKVIITGIVPFVSGATEITATSSDTDVATAGVPVVAAPSGTPFTQSAYVIFDHVADGTATATITIDGVEDTVDLTLTTFALDHGATGLTLSLGGVKTDTITKVGNAGAVIYAMAPGNTKASVHATTGLVTGLVAGDAVIIGTDAAGNTASITYTVTA